MWVAENICNQILRWFKNLLSVSCLFIFSWGYNNYVRWAQNIGNETSHECKFIQTDFSYFSWWSFRVSILSCNEYLRCSTKYNKSLISSHSKCVRQGTKSGLTGSSNGIKITVEQQNLANSNKIPPTKQCVKIWYNYIYENGLLLVQNFMK